MKKHKSVLSTHEHGPFALYFVTVFQHSSVTGTSLFTFLCSGLIGNMTSFGITTAPCCVFHCQTTLCLVVICTKVTQADLVNRGS